MQAQQEAFLKAMTGGWPTPASTTPGSQDDATDLDEIKKQLAELQQKLSKMNG